MRSEVGQATAEDGTGIAFHATGAGPAVVLVHSAAADSRQWSRVVPLLADSFTVVAMERRGRGRSGPFRPDHSMEVEYGDVVAVAAAAASNNCPVHLVGHSSGARYALHAAPRIPNLASLVLYEPPQPEDISDEVADSLTRLAASHDREGILWTFFVALLGMSEEDFSVLKARPIWPLMVDNALTMPHELRAHRSYRFDPAGFAELSVPTMLLVGEHSDPEDRRMTELLGVALPNAHVVTLAGQGHGAMIGAPDLFASVLRRFFATVGG